MTEKQQKIIQAALQLFATEGYHATATSKVAKAAGVSEGLIFRHFDNKEGLLQAILREGETGIKALYADVVLENDPSEIIRKTIALPFSVPETDYDFWRLQYKLKWELQYQNQEKTAPLLRALEHAFQALSYPHPKREAELLLHIIDGLGSAIIKGTITDKDQIHQLLLEKYQL